MPVFNSIFIGFPWSQQFLLDDALLPPGEVLRIGFRQSTMHPVLFTLTEGSGITRAADSFTLSLTDEQTETFIPGKLFGDLVTDNAGTDRHLGVRITVPILRSATPPA